jgi:hypothetical protein
VRQYSNELIQREEVTAVLIEALLHQGWVEDRNGNYRIITSTGKQLRLKLKSRVVLVDVNRKEKYKRRLRIASAYYSDVHVDKKDNKYRILIGGIEL